MFKGMVLSEAFGHLQAWHPLFAAARGLLEDLRSVMTSCAPGSLECWPLNLRSLDAADVFGPGRGQRAAVF